MIIRHVKLYCANLSEQKHFYTKKFRFELIKANEGSITFKIGDSLLTFTENKLQNSYYHIAFNIPYGSVDKALKWVKKQVDILHHEKKEIQEFPSWNARAIYFLDPAGNVIEFIGREKLQGEGDAHDGDPSFSQKSLLHISEVGLPVFQVSSAANMICGETGIPQFDCQSNTFCAIGDHRGLFIVVDKAEKTWFPSDEQAKAFPLEVDFTQERQDFTLKLQAGDRLEITKAKKKNNSQGN